MTPEQREAEHRRLQEFTRQNLMRLLDSELKLALTMSRLAQTEAAFGGAAHGRLLLEKVEEAIQTVHQHLGDDRIPDGERKTIKNRLEEATKLRDVAKQQVLRKRSRS